MTNLSMDILSSIEIPPCRHCTLFHGFKHTSMLNMVIIVLMLHDMWQLWANQNIAIVALTWISLRWCRPCWLILVLVILKVTPFIPVYAIGSLIAALTVLTINWCDINKSYPLAFVCANTQTFKFWTKTKQTNLHS